MAMSGIMGGGSLKQEGLGGGGLIGTARPGISGDLDDLAKMVGGLQEEWSRLQKRLDSVLQPIPQARGENPKEVDTRSPVSTAIRTISVHLLRVIQEMQTVQSQLEL